ncbi:hypothetical protein [Streptomyces sp. NPDC055243]|uniref:hypothetical protein n=1 Tax=Streptomyces sp. NPDC055243 TaxID=3365720 RepID=UPI0037D8686D
MITAKDVPHFSGDLEQLEQHASGLRAHAGALRQAGGAVHSKFQGLGAFYRAPEAEELFASTAPVRDRADLFASKIETVARALDDYAGAVRPIIARLDHLRTQVADFRASLKTDSGEIDDEWTQDQGKIDQHAALWGEVAQAQADFTKAETAANNKITALVDGTQYVPQGYKGTLVPRGMQVYGYTAEALKHADKLPWGTPEALTYDKFDLSHHVREASGSIKDNVVGTVTGLVDLVSPGADGDAARKGLGMTVLGLESYLFDPLNKQDSPWKKPVAEGRPYTKTFAKALVGWDDWEDHPGKATGTVFFNGLTLASGPLAAVSKLAKGGAVAKTAGTLAKVGEAIDPLSAAARTIGATTRAAPKIADVTARVRAGFGNAPGAGSASTMWRFAPHSQVHVGNGELTILKNGVPDTTPPRVELSADERTPSIAAPRDHQNVIQRPDEMPKGGAAAERANAGAEALPRGGPVLVGAHAGDDAAAALGRGGDVPPRSSPLQGPGAASRTGDGVGGAAGRAGDDIGGVGRDVSGGTASHLPPGASGGFTNGPSASHELPGSGGRTTGPGGGDHTPGGTVNHDGVSVGGHTTTGHGAGSAGSHGDGVVGGDGFGARGQADTLDGLSEIDPSRYSRPHDEMPHEPTGPLKPEQEARLLAELSHAKIKLRDQEAVLHSLRKDPYGASVAEIISRGHLRGTENYSKILDMCKQGPSRSSPDSMVPAAHMALVHATELQGRGFTRLGFEFGEPTDLWDLDVYTRNADGEIDYAYQLKNVASKKKLIKNAESAIEQLRYEYMNHGVAILDVHHPMSILRPGAFKAIEEAAMDGGATVLLRFEDGAIKIPADGPIYP